MKQNVNAKTKKEGKKKADQCKDQSKVEDLREQVWSPNMDCHDDIKKYKDVIDEQAC